MKKPAQTFEDLIAWQKAHKFVLKVYSYTSTFPKAEQFGLQSQFRRASVSIAANLAEGFKKRGKRDKLRFYNIAQGSVEECRYYIILAKDLGYGENSFLKYDLERVSKLIEAYYKAILNSEF
ncbi:MAG: four helix bundle protein [Balneolaceae bacterium]|nr:four helix bundle protein [Balneolaceae bacterium]